MNGQPTAVHPSSIIGPQVVLGEGCEVGPFCRFEGKVVIGSGCRFGTGVVVGTPPMDKSYQGEESGVVIGKNNLFFEFVTIHRATGVENRTIIGDNNYIMSYVHIAHNCRIGNNCTITNGVQLGGYSEVSDGANLGGLVGVHQFCRIGRLAMVGAHSYVNRDILPFMLATGNPCRIRGVNRVGLERAGYCKEKIDLLSEVFKILFRSGEHLSKALKRLESDFGNDKSPLSAEVEELKQFCYSSRRGIELRTGPRESEEIGLPEDSR